MAQIPEALLGYGLRRQRPPGALTWLSWAWRAGPAHPIAGGDTGRGHHPQGHEEPRRLEQTTRTLAYRQLAGLCWTAPHCLCRWKQQ